MDDDDDDDVGPSHASSAVTATSDARGGGQHPPPRATWTASPSQSPGAPPPRVGPLADVAWHVAAPHFATHVPAPPHSRTVRNSLLPRHAPPKETASLLVHVTPGPRNRTLALSTSCPSLAFATSRPSRPAFYCAIPACFWPHVPDFLLCHASPFCHVMPIISSRVVTKPIFPAHPLPHHAH